MVLGVAEPEFIFDISNAILEKSDKKLFELVDKSIVQGVSVPQLTKDLIMHYRNLLFAKIGADDIIELAKEQIVRLKQDSGKYSTAQIRSILKALSGAEVDMKWHQNNRLVLEVALMEMIEVESLKVESNGVETHGNASVRKEEEKNIVVKSQPVVVEKTVFISEGGDLPLIMSVWKQILEKVKEKSLFGFVSLCEGEPVGFDHKGHLMIKFRKGYSFHKSRAEETKNKVALDEAIKEFANLQIGTVCVMEGDFSGDAVRTASPVQANPAVSLDDVLEMFDGEVVK